jgi:hypothetical protein
LVLGPANILYLEWGVRNGQIKSWECDQEQIGVNGKVKVLFTPIKPLEYINIDFEIKTKD